MEGNVRVLCSEVDGTTKIIQGGPLISLQMKGKIGQVKTAIKTEQFSTYWENIILVDVVTNLMNLQVSIEQNSLKNKDVPQGNFVFVNLARYLKSPSMKLLLRFPNVPPHFIDLTFLSKALTILTESLVVQQLDAPTALEASTAGSSSASSSNSASSTPSQPPAGAILPPVQPLFPGNGSSSAGTTPTHSRHTSITTFRLDGKQEKESNKASSSTPSSASAKSDKG